MLHSNSEKDFFVTYKVFTANINFLRTGGIGAGAFFNPKDLAVFSESSLIDLCSLLAGLCFVWLFEVGSSPIL